VGEKKEFARKEGFLLSGNETSCKNYDYANGISKRFFSMT